MCWTVPFVCTMCSLVWCENPTDPNTFCLTCTAGVLEESPGHYKKTHTIYLLGHSERETDWAWITPGGRRRGRPTWHPGRRQKSTAVVDSWGSLSNAHGRMPFPTCGIFPKAKGTEGSPGIQEQLLRFLTCEDPGFPLEAEEQAVMNPQEVGPLPFLSHRDATLSPSPNPSCLAPPHLLFPISDLLVFLEELETLS